MQDDVLHFLVEADHAIELRYLAVDERVQGVVAVQTAVDVAGDELEQERAGGAAVGERRIPLRGVAVVHPNQRVRNGRAVAEEKTADDHATGAVVVDARDDGRRGVRAPDDVRIGDRVDGDEVVRMRRQGMVEADVDHPPVVLLGGPGNDDRGR